MLKILKVATVAALLAAPIAVHAQGVIGGMKRGAAEGNAAVAPVGAIAGGAVGGAVGGANGALASGRAIIAIGRFQHPVNSPGFAEWMQWQPHQGKT